jgi:hypothetical protein
VPSRENGSAPPIDDLDQTAAALLQEIGKIVEAEPQADKKATVHIMDASGRTDDGRPGATDRAQILAAFSQNRAPTEPTPPPPSKPTEPLSDAAVDELIAGWRAGNLAWPRRLLGGEPGHADCRLSRETLRRNGLS